MVGRSRKRFLSGEETELWAHVTRRDKPLRRKAVNAVESASPPPDNEPAIAAPPRPAPEAAAAPKPAAGAKSKPAAPLPKEAFDPRIGRKIARGRSDIDARLDLHGMRQHDAYAALKRFLARCQAEGHRHVLIITGKGGNSEEADLDFWRSPERGVLRRLVPHWLSEPSLRPQVVSFTESAHRHGGSGALYVTIRKAARHKPGGRE
jgi:DNA-nicking Smr family endonuclease